MSDESTLFTIQWGDELRPLAQQMQEKLAGTTEEKHGVVGERTTMEQVAARPMKRRTVRHAPVVPTDPDLRRRWITMIDYDDYAIFDKQDQLKTLLDPKNAFNRSLIMGGNRLKDQVRIDAAIADTYYGKDGSSTVSISTPIANGGTGLTQAKLRQINENYDTNNVDPDEEKFLIIGPKDHTDLLKLSEVVSKDFNDRPVLVKGRVEYWMGHKIIVSNLLSTTSGITKCISFVRSGLGIAFAMDFNLSVDQRVDLTGKPWQASANISVGAARLEETKVQECDTYHA